MSLILPRKKTRTIKIGSISIGGKNKIIVQSMCNTLTKNVKATVRQIEKLTRLGCELVRISIPDVQSAKAISVIKKHIKIPLCGDIHFDYKLAILALENGIDKIRINPGNIPANKLEIIASACLKKNIPIRIGVNAGSLSALKKLKKPPVWNAKKWAEIMVAEALHYVKQLESLDFENIVVSLKADDILRTYLACKLFAKRSNLPQHIGITESGTSFAGTIKSAIGLSKILNEGIGDTIRVSLADNPEKEVLTGFEILKSLGIRQYGPDIIACPTCARCQMNVGKIAKKLEHKIYSDRNLRQKTEGLKIAVMGCVVNGPGEAKTADLALTASANYAILFKKGKLTKKIPKNKIFSTILQEIKKFPKTLM